MTDERMQEAAVRAQRTEAKALTRLGADLPGAYSAAVQAIRAAPGRVVVAGVGKSDHVGRKISATLATTDPPSLCVEPTEAGHGDLGSICSGDICLLLSHSRETSELDDILANRRRFGIPVVAITGRADSTLGRAATHALEQPATPEASPMGLALVDDPMDDEGNLPRVGTDTPMAKTLIEMTSKDLCVAAVVAPEDHPTGIVTGDNLRPNISDHMDGVADDAAVTVGPETLAAEASALLQERRISALLVVDAAGVPVGVPHVQDLPRAGVA